LKNHGRLPWLWLPAKHTLNESNIIFFVSVGGGSHQQGKKLLLIKKQKKIKLSTKQRRRSVGSVLSCLVPPPNTSTLTHTDSPSVVMFSYNLTLQKISTVDLRSYSQISTLILHIIPILTAYFDQTNQNCNYVTQL
jgi:hypothetical protein